MIRIKEENLRKLVAEAYNMSVPVGMGMMHFVPGSLSEEDIAAILDEKSTRNSGIVFPWITCAVAVSN